MFNQVDGIKATEAQYKIIIEPNSFRIRVVENGTRRQVPVMSMQEVRNIPISKRPVASEPIVILKPRPTSITGSIPVSDSIPLLKHPTILKFTSPLKSEVTIDLEKEVFTKSSDYFECIKNEFLKKFKNDNSMTNIYLSLKEILIDYAQEIRLCCIDEIDALDVLLFHQDLSLQKRFKYLCILSNLSTIVCLEFLLNKNRYKIKESYIDQKNFSSTGENIFKAKFADFNNKRGNLDILLNLIEKKDPELKNIKTISFESIDHNNLFWMKKFLDIILAYEELFPELEEFTFEKIYNTLSIDGFRNLKILKFKEIVGKVHLSNLPALERISYYRKSIAYKYKYELHKFDGALKLKNMTKSNYDVSKFLRFIEDDLEQGCIKTITFEDFLYNGYVDAHQQLMDLIYSKQDLLTGLEKIKVTHRSEVKIPQFHDKIKVVSI